ncbi:MAG: flagellar assembly protein FliW [Bryobacterales bacterium]|nr:flagellar assembly protein FliW [Bryobacterales bacterium]
MSKVDSKLFGLLSFEDDQIIHVRAGLPGLRHTTRLLPVSQRDIEPFLFFQSVDDPSLALLAVPLGVAKSDFKLYLSAEDRREIEFGGTEVIQNRTDIGAFALVSVGEDRTPTANLLAPIVISFRNNRAVQAIQQLPESYLRYPIEATVAREAPC